MATPLRVLMVEDSADDALLIERELRRGGYMPDVVRVETELALRAALKTRTFDLVLSDFSMPLFDGLAAYGIVRQYAPNIPFIFVSGRIGEERAVDAMRRGVNDYVLKDHLVRLLPAVRRELAQVEVARARHTADQALRESEEKYRQLVEHSLQGLMIVQKGRIVYCNQATARMFGCERPEELIGTEALNVVHPDDRHDTLRSGRGLSNGSANLLPEYRGMKKDGTIIWYEARAAPTTWQGRRAIQWALLDITVRKRAEEELRANQRLLETVIDTIPHALLVKDREGRYLMVNRAWCERYGLEREQVLGRHTRELPGRTPDALERAAEEDQRVFETGRTLMFEGVGVIRGGQRRDFQTTKAPLLDESGGVRGLVGVVVDLTDQKKAEREVRDTERLLRTVFETIPHAVFVKDREGRYLAVNRAWCDRYNCPPEDAVGKLTIDVPGRPDVDKRRAVEEDRQVMHVLRRPISFQGEDHTNDGRTLHFQSYKAPLLDESGTVMGLVGVVVDTTDIKRTEAELRASQRLLQTVFDTIPHILIVKDLESRYLMVNKAWCEAYGIPPERALGRKTVEVGGQPDGEITQFMEEDRRVISGNGSTYTGEHFHTLHGGERRLLQAIKTPLRDETGAVIGLVGVFVDRTAERKAQHDADVAHARLLDAIENLPAAFLLFDAQERLVLWNTRVQEFFPELSPALKPGTAFEELVRLAAPATMDADADREAWIAGRLAQFRGRPGRFEQRLRSGRWIEGVDWRTAGGGTVCLRLDVTDAKNREAQLRQAQKMEVVGQLTGGVAHDLNNLLQVISGSALMAQRGLDPGRNETQFLSTAIDACMRAAALTRQLLPSAASKCFNRSS
jgi:PAS domain S-box-containing protein